MHIHDEILKELTIPGFVLLEYKNRKKTSQNTSSGGLAMFVRHAIKKIVHTIETGNQDIIWLKMDKKYIDSSNDIYIGTSYISPHKGKLAESKKLQNLAEDIVRFKRQGGNIILQGDFNARTSNDIDFIQPDKYDDTNNQIETLNMPLRNSQDKISDGRGKELLDLCKSLDLTIINGRKTGDPFGAPTSFQWNGNSVIDYAISSQTLFSQIITFKVGAYKPWISDHCPLNYFFRIKNPHHIPSETFK